MASAATRSFKLNRSLFNKDLYKRIQATWFADLPDNQPWSNESCFHRWFNNPDKNAAKQFDQKCRNDFYPALESILPEQLSLPPFKSWPEERAQASNFCNPFLPDITPTDPNSNEDVNSASSNALSIIILLDQMSRNILRDDQKLIYSHFDRLSQSVIHTILSTEPRLDRAPWIRYNPARRMWFYMPLMHAERLDDHKLFDKFSREMKADMEARGEDKAVEDINKSLGFEKKHVDIIEKFSRYPYRNKVLGRETTKEEEEWLETGDNFGTS